MFFPPSYFIVYDYTSFTSSLQEFITFCDGLGKFLKGTEMNIFDTYTGYRKIDVGDMILEYNDTCNKKGLFDMHRIVNDEGPYSEVIVPHEVAGMLGVYGNIVGSTVLHGLSTMNITGSELLCNVIGDDAGATGDENELSVREMIEAVRSIGDIEEGKFETWEEDEDESDEAIGWHFVKRPITVSCHTIKQGWMPDFPIIPMILNQEDGQHTLQPLPLVDRRRLLIKQTCRLFDSMRMNPDQVSEEDRDIVISMLAQLYNRLRLPFHGSFPYRWAKRKGCYPDSVLCVAPLLHESMTIGWYTTLRNKEVPTGFIRIPLEMIQIDPLPDRLYVGLEFHYRSNRVLSLLEKIGYIERETEYEEVRATEEAVDRLYDFITGIRKKSYLYRVLIDYDQWESYRVSIVD
jgi:hypothetical protein